MPESLPPAAALEPGAADAAQLAAVGAWPADTRLALPGLGSVLFCHATPRNDEEVVTRLMPDDVLRPIVRRRRADVVVCGHTHMQFDRRGRRDARRQRRQRRHAVRAARRRLLAAARTGRRSCAGPTTTLGGRGRGRAAHGVSRTPRSSPGSTCWSRPTCSRPSRSTGLAQLEGGRRWGVKRRRARGLLRPATDCGCRSCSRRWRARARRACRLRSPTPAAWARWARWSARPTRSALGRGGCARQRRPVSAQHVDARSAAAAGPERRGAGASVPGALGAPRAAVGRRRGARRTFAAVRGVSRGTARGGVVDHGPAAAAVRERLKAAGIAWFATATTLAEARAAQAAGADAIVAQGFEAGGHRGAFDAAAAERQTVGLFALVPRLADHLQVPVIAAGGIGDGRGIAAALTLGASAVVDGHGLSALSRGADASGVGRRARRASSRSTPLPTRAFTGRLARAIATDFVLAAAAADAPRPAPYPVQRGLTAAMKEAGAAASDHPPHAGVGGAGRGDGAAGAGGRPAGGALARRAASPVS